MYSLFVRSNIGSRFHKVEHRLDSLISSRALCPFHGKSSALAVLTVLKVTRNIFHEHDECFILQEIKPTVDV